MFGPILVLMGLAMLLGSLFAGQLGVPAQLIVGVGD